MQILWSLSMLWNRYLKWPFNACFEITFDDDDDFRSFHHENYAGIFWNSFLVPFGMIFYGCLLAAKHGAFSKQQQQQKIRPFNRCKALFISMDAFTDKSVLAVIFFPFSLFFIFICRLYAFSPASLITIKSSILILFCSLLFFVACVFFFSDAQKNRKGMKAHTLYILYHTNVRQLQRMP